MTVRRSKRYRVFQDQPDLGSQSQGLLPTKPNDAAGGHGPSKASKDDEREGYQDTTPARKTSPRACDALRFLLVLHKFTPRTFPAA